MHAEFAFLVVCFYFLLVSFLSFAYSFQCVLSVYFCFIYVFNLQNEVFINTDLKKGKNPQALGKRISRADSGVASQNDRKKKILPKVQENQDSC